MEVPVKLEIPDELVGGFLSGSVEIAKAVVRDNSNGRIIKHIPLNNDMDLADQAREALKNKGVLAGAGVALTVLVVGGVAFFISSRKKKKAKEQAPECVMRFNEKFRVYLEEAKSGELNVETIDNLLAELDEIEANQGTDVKIDFSTGELKTMLTQIFKFTQELAEAKNTSASDLNSPSDDSESNIVYLRDYLLLQKKIVEIA